MDDFQKEMLRVLAFNSKTLEEIRRLVSILAADKKSARENAEQAKEHVSRDEAKAIVENATCEVVLRNGEGIVAPRMTKPDRDGVQWLSYRAKGEIRGFAQKFFTIAFKASENGARELNEGDEVNIIRGEATQFKTEKMKFPELYLKVSDYSVFTKKPSRNESVSDDEIPF